MKKTTEDRLKHIMRNGKQLQLSYAPVFPGASIGVFNASWVGCSNYAGIGDSTESAIVSLISATPT